MYTGIHSRGIMEQESKLSKKLGDMKGGYGMSLHFRRVNAGGNGRYHVERKNA